MKYFGAVLFFLLSVSSCFAERLPVVYVSSSTGHEFYDGRSPETPTSNINKAINSADVVLLKAGDLFYIGGLSITGIRLSRYGEGNNPTICGYKRIITPNWEFVKKNVWRLSLVDDNFTGIVLNGSSASNNICAFHEYDKDEIHGRKVWKRSELQEDWDFWQTETLSMAKPQEYDFVYLYLSRDPNQLKLEMSIYDQALRVSHSVVDGVNFEGFGFGISAKTNTQIRNCRIDVMGGRIIPEGRGYNCYGNGIEFYLGGSTNIENCIVEDCYVSRCYDCGITIQGTGGTIATPRNIIIRNNLITKCCQGWEDFLRNNKDVVYENCTFANNIVIHSGDTNGFGYQKSRFKYCHVLGNNVAGDKGMRIENNVFADGNFYCSGVYNNAYRSNLWSGNKCYIESGSFFLGEYFGRRDVLRVGKSRRASSAVISSYRYLTGDNTTTFYVRSRNRVLNKADKLEKDFLKVHKY